jgi:DNA replication factor GINS
VRITSDVDEFYGVDERRYDLDAEDVVQLPEANAKPLLQKEAAERLD